jgi:hypothetical protein
VLRFFWSFLGWTNVSRGGTREFVEKNECKSVDF